MCQTCHARARPENAQTSLHFLTFCPFWHLQRDLAGTYGDLEDWDLVHTKALKFFYFCHVGKILIDLIDPIAIGKSRFCLTKEHFDAFSLLLLDHLTR